MTLTIIFLGFIIIGIGLCVWAWLDKDYTVWRECIGVLVMITFAMLLIINLICWIPSDKNSEIAFNQLTAEKIVIEAMLDTDKTIDRFQLNSAVIGYNNKIIKERINYKRLIFKEYYNQELGWSELQLIEWR